MARIQIKRLDGGVMFADVTWRQVQRAGNGVTTVCKLFGSGPSLTVDQDLKKLRGVTTNWGIYKSHSLQQGAPNIYDIVEIEFQVLKDPPVYLYNFKGALASAPLKQHPGYKTYWDHDIVAIIQKGGNTSNLLSGTEMNTLQAITDATIPESLRTFFKWRKAGQSGTENEVVAQWQGTGSEPTSGHTSGLAKKGGQTTFKVPSITVQETIYFTEKSDFTFSFGAASFTIPNLNTKTIASMEGKAGWPLRCTFGYPRDTYSLLNLSKYSDYLTVGRERSESGGTETVTPISINEAFFKSRGTPITQYLTSSTTGYYKGEQFGHPLWICSSVSLKKTGYWYEAVLSWEYYSFGIDSDVYPLATARVNGSA